MGGGSAISEEQQQQQKVARLDEEHTHVHSKTSSTSDARNANTTISSSSASASSCPSATKTMATTTETDGIAAERNGKSDDGNLVGLATGVVDLDGINKTPSEQPQSSQQQPQQLQQQQQQPSSQNDQQQQQQQQQQDDQDDALEAARFLAESNELQHMHTLAQEQRRLIEEETRKTPLIDERLPIRLLAHEYQRDNPLVQKKIEDLSIKYTDIRRVRGDGNCFFRAFTFAVFEHLLNEAPWFNSANSELHRIRNILLGSKEKLIRLGFPAFAIEDFHDLVMEQFALLVSMPVESIMNASMIVASDSTIPADPIALLEQSNAQLLINFREQSISDYMIAFMRFIVSGHLRENSAQFEPFITNGMAVPQFCESEVEPMGIESDHIHIIALSQALGICVRIEYLDAQSDQRSYNTLDDKPPTVVLLYRPGHYDILYSK